MSTETTIRRGRSLTLSTSAPAQSNRQELSIAQIRRDGGTQARTGNSEDVVEEYTSAMREERWRWHDGNALTVFFDGEHHWLGDGFHRCEAASRAGLLTVPCEVRDGERRDAVLFACGANDQHGLRRSRDDVRRSIEILLRDEEWGKWSNAEIARRVGCSDMTVGKLRRDLESTSQIGRLNERIGADGKVRQAARYIPHPVTPDDLATEGYQLLRSPQKAGQVKLLRKGQAASYYPSAPAAIAAARERIKGAADLARTPAADLGDSHEALISAGRAGNVARSFFAGEETPARCFDCGTTEGVTEVGGAVKHLCLNCRLKRGGPMQDGLGDLAKARGWAYRGCGGQLRIEKAGMHMGWMSPGAGSENLEALLQRSIAEIESRVAGELSGDARPAEPDRILTSSALRDWQRRAAAVGCNLVFQDEDKSYLLTMPGGHIAVSEAHGAEDLIAQIKQLETCPPTAAHTCKTCRQPRQGVSYSGDCTGCYHLRLAQRGGYNQRWNLEQARAAALQWPESDRRTARLAEITDMLDALDASGDAPDWNPVPAEEFRAQQATAQQAKLSLGWKDGQFVIWEGRSPTSYSYYPANSWEQAKARLAYLIEQGQREPEPEPEDPMRRSPTHERHYMRAEEMIAGVLERLSKEEVRLLAVLLIPDEEYEPGDDGAEGLWVLLTALAHQNPARLAVGLD